ncbi:winged helix-turn-helix transcriptional regulator [Paenibacillus nasutitermitis]|uniref:HTH-type transcriptional regulator YvaP n=1 Tax=Paenibacillus nasutitermitis TaxID=1652958 RepID=A0A916Z5T3_9BACL|nr:helix-turn-helix domain-containing protein [Paenibacillus nasutitermitis]GGD77817.1 putative HTH-type transcriptional regulator YvaP [Paenibacillus nasutitermitis]
MDQHNSCQRFEKAIELLSKRWMALIVYKLLSGPHRFVGLENAVTNLSGKVLSDRLKELEAEGIIRRDVYPETPVRIEYSLTDKGYALAPLFKEIGEWATQWVELPDDIDTVEACKEASPICCREGETEHQ